MAQASDYRRLLVEARKEQLTATRANLQRLTQTYDAAAQSVAAQLADVPGYMLTTEGAIKQAYYRTLLLNIDRVLQNLWSDYTKLLDLGMLDLAQTTADREAKVEAMMTSSAARDPRLLADLSRSRTLSDGVTLTAQFGRVAESAVEAVAARVYRDGLRLSDRLYALDTGARRLVEDTLLQGIAEQVSAKELAGRLQSTLAQTGRQTPLYNAMRIARSELNTAHREAHARSLMTSEGSVKPYVAGVRWNLSMSHPMSDICDIWAAHDEGMGPGIYTPGTIPLDHPNGLCFVTTELKAFPGIRGPSKEPDVANVSDAQINYYASLGDVPAETVLSSRTDNTLVAQS